MKWKFICLTYKRSNRRESGALQWLHDQQRDLDIFSFCFTDLLWLLFGGVAGKVLSSLAITYLTNHRKVAKTHTFLFQGFSLMSHATLVLKTNLVSSHMVMCGKYILFVRQKCAQLKRGEWISGGNGSLFCL